MRTHARETMPLGDLIVGAFDMAAEYSTDAREISRVATGTVGRMLRLVHRAARPAPALFTSAREIRH
jgi:hypothetical protein